MEAKKSLGQREPQYELMHEHLVQILAEAPDPVLQKARDAEERLNFWHERTKARLLPDTEMKRLPLRKRLSLSFVQPIPLMESLRLRRYIRNEEERRMLNRNAQGFLGRFTVASLPFVIAMAVITLWTSSDAYQIRMILSEAPLAEAASAVTLDFDSDDAALSEWCRAMIISGRATEILAAAREIKVESARYDALAVVAQEMAKAGRSDEARAVFMEVESGWIESSFYRELTVLVLGWRGLDRDLYVARATINELDRSNALTAVASKLLKAGVADLAWEALTEALSAARAIKDKSDRSRALVSVAREMTKARNAKLARQALAEALSAARTIKDELDRSPALTAVASELLKAGDADLAWEALTEALAAARKIKFEPQASPYRITIALEMAKAGRYNDALVVSKEIQSKPPLNSALSLVAQEMAKAGRYEEALTIAREISYGKDRSKELTNVASELLKAGKADLARQVLTGALAVAREIKVEQQRFPALAAVALELLKAGNADSSRQTLIEALTTAQEIKHDDTRSSAFSAISKGFARLRDYQQARLTANKCSSSVDKLSAYAAILIEYTKEHNPKIRERLEDEEAEKEKNKNSQNN